MASYDGAGTFTRMTAAGASYGVPVASGSVVFTAMTAAGASQDTTSVAGYGQCALPAMTAAGVSLAYSTVGTCTFPAMTASGAASPVEYVAGGVTFTGMTAAGVSAGGSVASAACTFPAMTAAGYMFNASNVAASYKATVLNLATMALTEYNGMNFNSFGVYGSNILAAGPDGLYLLGGTTDNGAAIAAKASTGMLDFGTSSQKRVDGTKTSFVGPAVKITTVGDAEAALNNETSTTSALTGIHSEKLITCRGQKAYAFGFDIENVSGGAMSLKDLEVQLERLRGGF